MSNPVDSINSLATYFILLLFIYYLPRERRRFYINYFMPLYCRAAVLFCALSPWTQQSESACSNGGRARRNKARAPLFKLLMQWLQQAADINHLSQQLHVAPAPGSGRRMAALNSRCCIARSLAFIIIFIVCCCLLHDALLYCNGVEFAAIADESNSPARAAPAPTNTLFKTDALWTYVCLNRSHSLLNRQCGRANKRKSSAHHTFRWV